jgi:hypothetical protein
MKNAIAKSQLLLTVLLSMTGCSTTQVSNTCPAPIFPTCETLKAYKNVPDAVIRYQVEATTIMLKLRDRQPADEQQELVKCKR